jgi:pimeloyl-ACP methyl ester carboxylesterase
MSAIGYPYQRQTTVDGDGVDLAVWETAANGPTVLLVHGFPDTHALWDLVAARLVDDFHLIAYDVRGSGDSGTPRDTTAYRMRHLVADLVAVLDAASPDKSVHLVGHDWGSVQAWDAVLREKSDPRLHGRIASYTSISGPCLDHITAWARKARQGSFRDRLDVFSQGVRSCYISAFQIPRLPEWVLPRIGLRRVIARSEHMLQSHFAPSLVDDARHGLSLYRANIRHRVPVPDGPSTDLPVQLIVPIRDPYLSPAMYRGLAEFVPHLTRIDIDARHWVVRTHSDDIASLIAEFTRIHSVGPDPPSPTTPPGQTEPMRAD